MRTASPWALGMAALLSLAATANAQEGGEDIPPPPPADEVPPPPPGYGGSPPPAPPPQQAPAQYPQQQGYPTDGGYYPQQPPPGGYAPAPPDPGRHTHDGFFLRAKLGPAYLDASAEADGTELHYYGGGIGLTFSIGGAVAENLILFGELYGTSAPNPTIEVDGTEMDAGSGVNLSTGNIGIGLGYYIMPINMYVSGSVGTGTTNLEDDFGGRYIDGPTGGVRLNLDIGKEWWVSDNWGLGAAVNLFWGTSGGRVELIDVPSGSRTVVDTTYSTFSAGLHFSATYN